MKGKLKAILHEKKLCAFTYDSDSAWQFALEMEDHHLWVSCAPICILVGFALVLLHE